MGISGTRWRHVVTVFPRRPPLVSTDCTRWKKQEHFCLLPLMSMIPSRSRSSITCTDASTHSLMVSCVPPMSCLLERKLSSADTVMLVRVAPPPCVRTVASFTSPKLIQSVLFKHVWKVTPSPLSSPFLAPLIFSSLPLVTSILMKDHMSKMKNNAIVGNIGHFDNEIDMDGLMKVTKRINIKPQVDKFVFEDGHGVIVLAEG